MLQNKTGCVDILALHPEVTGSCNLMVIKHPNGEVYRIVVDLGLFQEEEYLHLNKKLPFESNDIDAVFITHNHVDHLGRLPLLSQNKFKKNIYLTEQTRRLAPLALEDSCKALQDLAKRRHEAPLFSPQDVSEVVKLFKGSPFKSPIQVNQYIKATFFQNGHLFGASVILFQITFSKDDKVNILFTGDYKASNTFFRVEKLPKWVTTLPLTIVSESTYGTTTSRQITPVFKDNVTTALNNGKNVLIMAFSLGRIQEILYTLKVMKFESLIDESVSIYFDGKLAFKYTDLLKTNDIFGIYPNKRNFLPSNVEYVSENIRETLLTSKNQKIIVTTSGMGLYGPAQVYIPELISNPNWILHFTGYGLYGKHLSEVSKKEIVNVSSILTQKLADVFVTNEFSSHATADELLEFSRQFKNLNSILVQHGQNNVKSDFARYLIENTAVKKVGVLGEQMMFRLDKYGIKKSVNLIPK